jgi:protein phosphatase
VTSAEWTDRKTGWTIRAGGASLLGNYRETNEDFFWLDPEQPLALVLDGFAGWNAFRQLTVDTIRHRILKGKESEPEARLRDAFRAGHETIVNLHKDKSHRCMGATVVAAWIHRGRVYTPWLGDAMAFRISQGRLEHLTWRHDVRNYFMRVRKMTEEEASAACTKNVLLWWMGGEWDSHDELEIPSFAPIAGDRLILATDGVHGVHAFLPDEALLETCRAHPEPKACAEEIANLALPNSRDNITCVVLAFEGTGTASALEPPKL